MTLSDIYDFNTISVNEESSETESIETQISDDGILFEFDITEINIFDNSSLLISTIEAPETIQPEDGLITAPSLVGRAISSLGDLNLTSSSVVDFDGDDPSTWTAFDDNAGIFTSADILNDNLLDDGDGVDIGIVSDADPFFGIADTINPDNGNGSGAQGIITASFVFDISTVSSNLSVSMDWAALGDFETNDEFTITASIDGGAEITLFTLAVAETSSQTYTFAGGNTTTIDDPFQLIVAGGATTTLSNVFQSFTSNIAGTGSTLTLSITGRMNGGGEGVAFRNIEVFGEAGPTPGDDNLMGTSGDDVIDLLDGDDTYDAGDGDDQIMGGPGADTLDGGDGFDFTQYNNATAGVVLSLITGGTAGDATGDTFTNIEGAVGSNFDDIISGSNIDNTLFGLDGNDMLFGLDGDDLLVGGNGDDELTGGAGADTLLGGAGTDSIFYTAATAGIALSLATGGTGGEAAGDTFGSIEQIFATNFDDTIVGSSGDETLHGMDGNDILSGAAGDDTLIGGNGNDRLFGGEGADSLQGGAGIDLASYAQSRSGVTVNLATNANSGGDAAGDMLTGIENLFGSRFGDNLTGDLNDNVISGLGGNDIIDGGAGNDRLFAGTGSDVLNGGTGNDTLSGQSGFNRLNGDAGNDLILGGTDQDFINGGAGNDIMSGGMGTDRFIFEAAHGTDRINDFEDGTDLIDLSALGIAFADLTLVQTSLNVEIDTGEGIIIVNNAMVADFDTTDFVF